MKRSIRRVATAAAALAVTGVLAGLPAPPAAAFVVCWYDLSVFNVNDSGSGSLRQAILDANTMSGLQTIGFNITGTGMHVIKPQSNLPTITDPVFINGYTEPGSAPATTTATTATPATLTVAINGTDVNTGLVLDTSGSTVTGLVVNRVGTTAGGGTCNGVGICVKGDNNTIRGDYVGVGHAGNTAEPNSTDGIKVTGTGNLIGGTVAADTNVISGNIDTGVHLVANADNTTIEGNRIGTDATATSAVANRTGVLIQSGRNLVGTNGASNTISGNSGDGVRVDGGDSMDVNTIAANLIGLTAVPGWAGLGGMPNGGNGVAVYAHNVVIGGDFPGDGNSIGTNGRNGILLGEGTTFTVVHGNFIGTDSTRAGGLGNVEDGVSIRNASSNAIGSSDSAVPPNVIISNRRGVYVTGNNAVDNPILGNSIDLNIGAAATGGLGIDLDPSGPNTPNDPGDGDGGPNDLQNYPDFVLQYVNPAGTPTIRWSLDSTPMTYFRVEVFASPGCDPSGFGEGATLLSFVVVRTTAGSVVFDTPAPVASGTGITTTATPIGAGQSTSEFSQCVVVP